MELMIAECLGLPRLENAQCRIYFWIKRYCATCIVRYCAIIIDTGKEISDAWLEIPADLARHRDSERDARRWSRLLVPLEHPHRDSARCRDRIGNRYVGCVLRSGKTSR